MWKEIGEWMAALLLTACVGIAVVGAAEWVEERGVLPAETDRVVIAVDPGHGGFDGGAVGTDSGVPEAGLNLAVSRLLGDALTQAGMEVVFTRESEEALGSNKQADLAARRAIFNRPEIDLVVSIHMNRYTDPAISGPMAYYMAGSEPGRRLAQSVIDAVCDALGRSRRLANPGDYFVVRECACPAVLVECGFLSNEEEEQKLLQPAYQQTLATAIAKGVTGYLAGTEDAPPAGRLQQKAPRSTRSIEVKRGGL